MVLMTSLLDTDHTRCSRKCPRQNRWRGQFADTDRALSDRVVALVVVLHALAKYLDRLQLLIHDRLAALLTDTAGHEIDIVALRQRGARRLRKLALLCHCPHISCEY